MTEKFVLIGAGSAMFTCGLVADLLATGQAADLALVDIHPEALETAERLAGKMIAAKRARIGLSASTDRRAVLRGATAVICTIGVGGRRAWEKDVFIPRRHGLFAPVGDTVGPGGTSRALRMIPPMVAIARDVLDLAPEALFFNYGNPMAPVCRAIRKATGARVVGLCHGVNDVAGYLAEVLNIPRSMLQYNAMGINHLTWFVAVRAEGQDALPRLRAIAARRLAEFPQTEDSPFTSPFGDPFSWQLLQRFGAFPAVLDRHATEFFPQFFREGRYFGRTLGVDVFSFEGTIAAGDRIYAQMRADALDPKPLTDAYFERFGGEHEQVIEIIDSIRRERGQVYSANLPNTGQVPNLPPEAIVEAPAVADGAGLRPIAQSPLPPALVGTLASRYQWVETVVEAALEGSREKFLQSLVLDGSVTSIEQAAALADELLAAHQEHLPWMNE
ncbi:MAG: family 4 glycosyl hydrolase [Anaerolineales bacterium]